MTHIKAAKKQDDELLVDVGAAVALAFSTFVFFALFILIYPFFVLLLAAINLVYYRGREVLKDLLLFYLLAQSVFFLLFFLMGENLSHLGSYIGIVLCLLGIYFIQASLSQVFGFKYSFRLCSFSVFTYTLTISSIFLWSNTPTSLERMVMNGTLEHLFVNIAFFLYGYPPMSLLLLIGIGPH